MAFLKFDNIAFSYPKMPVIKGITHVFEKNSFTAILGTNGSGKTTLIRLVNGILKPQSGVVSVEGTDLRQIPQSELAHKMAYVAQAQENVFPATVFDTVLSGRNPYMTWRPSEKDKNIVADILTKLNLGDIALKDINALSGGQRQKVFIARALAQDTPIIILDEPTASLDLKHQNEVLSLLNELSQKGKTIIMAIHDLNLAVKYCSHFILLKQGSLTAHGKRDILTEALIEDVFEVKVRLLDVEGRAHFLYV